MPLYGTVPPFKDPEIPIEWLIQTKSTDPNSECPCSVKVSLATPWDRPSVVVAPIAGWFFDGRMASENG